MDLEQGFFAQVIMILRRNLYDIKEKDKKDFLISKDNQQ